MNDELEVLRTTVREYYESTQAVHEYVNNYLKNGGDATVMPKQWEFLDRIRQGKLKAMLAAAGITQ